MYERNSGVTHCISLDYLDISYTFELPTFSKTAVAPISINKNAYICFTDSNSKYFSSSGLLYINNEYIGDIRYNPKSRSFIPSDTVHLRLSNHLLYTKYFKYYLEYIENEIGMKFNHILRLDVANDIVNHNVLPFIKTYENSSTISCKGKDKQIGKRLIGKKTEIIHFGSINSDKYIKIYNKSKSISDGTKNYIKDYWDLNGLDYTSGDVERLELTLQDKLAKLVDKSLLYDIDYLASLCRDHFKNYFEFYRTEKRRDKRKIVNVTPINFNKYYGYKIDKYKFIPLNSTRPAKQALKTLYMESLELEDKIMNSELPSCLDFRQTQMNINESIDYLVKENNLLAFYEIKKRTWMGEHVKRKRNAFKSL